MEGRANISASFGRNGLTTDLTEIGERCQSLLSYCFCIAAGLCATYLSGLNFPEQNNHWHIPIVLDFAGSAEGPHDAYNQSFANFISIFWIIVRTFTTEANIETVFVAIQLMGNALLACAIFTLLRQVSRSIWPSALVTAFLCFCYGLWGATQLGYSEIFVTYATHTQYASTLCLFGLALIVAKRPFWAAVIFGLAANLNLFMGVWGALAAGVMLLLVERRISLNQIGFSLLFLMLAGPVALWGLQASTGGGAVPYSFLRDFLAGHVYGLDYPKALAQTFALGITAALACFTALQDPAARNHLGAAMLACMMVLAIGTLMPYLTKIPHVALLHPLRFTSVVIPMAAICAGSLFIDAWRKPWEGFLFPAAVALAGFMLKLPVLSVFGFALAIPQANRNVRIATVALSMACVLALFLPAPATEFSNKSVVAFLLVCIVMATVSLLDPTDAPLPVRIVAVVLGGVTVVPFSALIGGAALFSLAAIVLCFGVSRWRHMASTAAGLSCLMLLISIRNDPVALCMIGLGALAVGLAPLMKSVPHIQSLAKIGLGGVVLALMLLGVLNGARDRFSPAPTAQQRDFLAAQWWARTHTPPDTLFMPAGVEDGFALMSRRPVWWEQSHGAAILWQPTYFPVWSCRKAALEAADTPQDMLTLSRREGVAFIVTSASEAHAYTYTYASSSPVFRNDHYAILEVDALQRAGEQRAALSPICPR